MPSKGVMRVVAVVVAYFALSALFYWIVRDAWTLREMESDSVNPTAYVGDLSGGAKVEQTFTCSMDELREIELQAASFSGNTSGSLLLQIIDNVGEERWSKSVPASELRYGEMNAFQIEPPIQNASGQRFILRVTGVQIVSGMGATLWMGDTRSAGRFDVPVTTDELLTLNGTPVEGVLVMRTRGVDHLAAARNFWPICSAIGVLITAFALYYEKKRITNPQSGLFHAEYLVKRYSYLLRQLVIRDFKIKYNASVLGVFWSFLNPLLMMVVYYVVFSTIFHNEIENFTVYLITGIVLFNYFSESTNLGLMSIVSNANLITKVYVPKYIYPISKSLSSAINMLISMIPMLLIMLFTGVMPTRSLLLLPFVIACIIIFSMGMCMLLSTSMAFFRDTQFLWSVLVTMFSFLTPVFYPESIIPQNFLSLYHMNPLYQFVHFLRGITLGGTAPLPGEFLGCLLAAFIPLVVGFTVFRHYQDEFVLYL